MCAAEAPETVEIPGDWSRAARRIIARGWTRILVLGQSDRGKSTFCRVLLTAFAKANSEAYFVDADIAQKDIGPPGTITLARYRHHDDQLISLAAGSLCESYFVGAINPMGHFLEMIIGTARLTRRVDGRATVIDTTGLVSGAGRQLKRGQIESLEPDAIVALTRGNELELLLREYRHLNVVRVAPARAARRRSVRLRRLLREQSFADYFDGAKALSFPKDSVFIQRGRLQSGLLCGVADSRGHGLGVGLIMAVDHSKIDLLTPVTEKIRIIQAGHISVGPNGTHHQIKGSTR